MRRPQGRTREGYYTAIDATERTQHDRDLHLSRMTLDVCAWFVSLPTSLDPARHGIASNSCST